MPLVLLLLLLSNAGAQKTVELTSPDRALIFTLKLQNGSVQYSLAYNKQLLIDKSPLALHFDNGWFRNNLVMGKPVFSDTTETYQLHVGKVSRVQTHYTSVAIPLAQSVAPFRNIHLRIKAFGDGIAFRYEIPKQKGWTSYTLLDEATSFHLKGNPVARALYLPNYTTSHEGRYSTQPLQDIPEDTLVALPALFRFANNTYLAITEASLLDYAGMYLGKKQGRLISKLSPLPGQVAEKVKAMLPHHTPWRVLMVSNRVGALIESNILTNLTAPTKIKDLSWIIPGKSTFPWWNGNVVPDTLNAPGNNFVTAQYYIDFCARNGLQYHSVVEYGLHPWYIDDGVNFQPGPAADVTRPVPGLNMKAICDYAATRGVGVRVWVHWAALYPKLDTAFALFERWGLKGMMVDFMDRDDQEMVNIQTEILEKAAKHKLHIQFHGSYKPTGLHRTYPNEFTREGTLNYEANKWNEKGIPPDHDIDIPFTRMLAGSTDYHLGGFRTVPTKDFRPQYTKPL
ncbi:MAG: glycoside hydrolase family 97 catalytic domain-containing protein, partial [Chitinophagaceae bacterium]